ncbi:MAG TPA: hypothetical protein VHI77_10565 [Solirubrobacterales bacterium]|jgi:hypothetical protein|nr:hypothetical protein [Solirubrobacterales bacterium]
MGPIDRRSLRKRGVLARHEAGGRTVLAQADAATRRRLRRINAISASAFVLGGSLFAVGAALSQGDVGGPRLAAAVYLVGGVFFTTGAYAALLQVANAPRGADPEGILRTPPWRWWSLEPGHLDWASAVTLFVGTLFFFVSLVLALLGDLTIAQQHRLVWSPEVVGCVLFLVSGHLALTEMHRDRPRGRRADLGWWIAVVNQLGSALFMVAAIAAFVRPASGDELAVGIANWGTLTGALCFAVAAAMQEFERPP